MQNGSNAPEIKAQEIVSQSRMRNYDGKWKYMIMTITALFSLIFVSSSFMTVIPFHVSLAIYVGGTVVFIFLFYPANDKSPRNAPTILDWAFILFAILGTLYYITQYEELLLNAGNVRTTDIIFGLMIIIACLEACRRVLGIILPILCLIFVFYNLFGQYIPGMVGHSGFSLERLVGTIYSYDGVYGIVARTYAVYVLIFILLGAFLEKSGAGEAFTNLALSLIGRSKGGAAKASVISSGLTGMVIGSGAANIAITGTFTIPLMKKTGFSKERAGATETVASIGGHVMPPVMGAAAFLMASFTGISYLDICIAAAFPAILLYMSLYASVHFYSKRNDFVKAVDPSELPPLKTTLKRDGILLLPIVVLIICLALGFSPFRAAIMGIVFSILVAYPNRKTRFNLFDIFETLSKGAISSLTVGATAGVMGVLLAALLLPGVPLSFSSWVVHLSGGSLLLTLLLVIVSTYILGMGMTITAAYIITSIVVVSPMIDLGVPVMAAHLVIIWFCQYSSFNPPFCLGALVAAGISGGNPMKTGWVSVLMGKAYYIIPFLMVYSNILMPDGFSLSVAQTWFTCAIGLLILSGVFERYIWRMLHWWEIIVLTIGCALLFWPSTWTDMVGLVMVVLVLVPQYLQVRKNRTTSSIEAKA